MIRLAVRGMRARAIRLAITMLAVFLSVAFMAGTAAIGDTVRTGFAQTFSQVYSGIDVMVQSDEEVATPFGLRRDLVREEWQPWLTTVDGVQDAVGVVQYRTRLTGRDARPVSDGQAPEFLLNWLGDRPLNQWRLVSGRAPGADGEAVVSASLARDHQLTEGALVTVSGDAGPRTLRVVGSAEFRGEATYAGTQAVIVDTPTAQDIAGSQGRFTFIAVDGDGTAEELATGIQDAVDALAPGAAPSERGAQAVTNAVYVAGVLGLVDRLVSLLTTLVSAFGAVALLVGAFIIANTFAVLVSQRRREVGLLRAVGASRAQVMALTLTEALVAGVIAAGLGALGGIAVAYGLDALLTGLGVALPGAGLVLSPASFVVPALAGMAVTVAAGVGPALRSSRTSPLAVLRTADSDESGRSWVRALTTGVLIVAAGALVYVGLADPSIPLAAAGCVAGLAAVVVAGPLYLTVVLRAMAKAAGWMGATWTLALGNAARSPKRAATCAGALVVTTALVSTIAFAASSFQASRDAELERGLRADLVVSSKERAGGVPDGTAASLEGLPGVEVATALRYTFASNGTEPVVLIGVDAARVGQVYDFGLDADSAQAGLVEVLGSAGAAPDAVAALAPQSALARGGVRVGDVLTLDTTTGALAVRVTGSYGNELVPQVEGYVVDRSAYEAATDDRGGKERLVLVLAEPGADIGTVRDAVAAALLRVPDAQVQTPTTFVASQGERLDQVLSFLYGLLALAVLIGVLGVVNTLLLSVWERRREIGLLRALGASRRQVRRIVRIESVVLSLVAAMIGVLAGALSGWVLIRAFSAREVIVAVPWMTLVAVFAAAVVTGVLAALVPAWRATHVDMLEAIGAE